MMKLILNIFFLCISVNLIYCQSKQDNNNTKKGKGIIKTVSPDDFENMFYLEGAQLVDVRTAKEFDENRIKGAQNIDYNSADFEKLLTNLDKKSPVLLYCLSGVRSTDAAQKMYSLGFTKVYHLDGGILKWEAAGKPVQNKESIAATKGISVEDFNKAVSVSRYVLVDYNAEWCGPCKKMLPILERVTAERKDKMTLLKIDVDYNKTIAREKKIEGIPYLELYENGKLVWQFTGYINEATLLRETGL